MRTKSKLLLAEKMKKQTLNVLNEEESKKQEIMDSWKHIKDLEAELEFLYSREPQEKKYI